MKNSQLRNTILIALSAALFTAVAPVTSQAKTRVRYYQNIKNATYTVANRHATVYTSGQLTHKKGTLGAYGSKVTAYYAAHVTKNGRSSVYYKFKVGKRTGWVWRGYLKKAKVAEKFSEAKADAEFLKLINEHRVAAGAQPVTVDSTLFQKVTLPRASQIITHFDHVDSAGNFIAADLADVAGIQYDTFSENIADESWLGTSQKTADDIFDQYFYHDADSDWGHRDNILNSRSTKVAIASVYKNGVVYNVMDFYG